MPAVGCFGGCVGGTGRKLCCKRRSKSANDNKFSGFRLCFLVQSVFLDGLPFFFLRWSPLERFNSAKSPAIDQSDSGSTDGADDLDVEKRPRDSMLFYTCF